MSTEDDLREAVIVASQKKLDTPTLLRMREDVVPASYRGLVRTCTRLDVPFLNTFLLRECGNILAGLGQNLTGPGFPVVVFGGAHADIALGEAHGQALAEIVGTSNTPAILDTRQMSVGSRTRFFTDFAETLLQKNKGPLHLIVDEAHLFAPQGPCK